MFSSITRPLVSLAIALATTVASHAAFAQVEARCPTGWAQQPVPPGSPGEHVVIACLQEPLQIVMTEVGHVVVAGGPEESALVQQVAQQMGDGTPPTATPVHPDTISGIAMRVADLTPAGATGPGAALAQMAFIVHGESTDVLMVAKTHPGPGDVHAAMRAFLPSVLGLSGTLPPWLASATCPPGAQTVPARGAPANGMRQVARCAGEGGPQLDVLESHLPLRNADDARAPALALHGSISRQLARVGGSATIDATVAFTAGAVHGFLTAVHASATDPSAPQGAPPASLRVEALVVAIPTPSGHVQIIAVTQGGDPATVRTQLETFVSTQLRLDGSGVTATPPPSEGGATSEGPPAESQPPRHREPQLDPNAPPWEPPPADRPHATEPAPQHKACGCSTPGAVHTPAWGLTSLVALASVVRRRRRSQH